MTVKSTFITKVCPKCGIEKEIGNFSVRQKGRGSGQALPYCKVCTSLYVSERHAVRIKRDPTIYRRNEWPSKLKNQYGITVDDYYRILAEQGGGCAVCGSKTAHVGSRKYVRNVRIAFDVDHDHKTGKVRGLLCTRCNRLVGLANDDPNTARKLVDYLTK